MFRFSQPVNQDDVVWLEGILLENHRLKNQMKKMEKNHMRREADLMDQISKLVLESRSLAQYVRDVEIKRKEEEGVRVTLRKEVDRLGKEKDLVNVRIEEEKENTRMLKQEKSLVSSQIECLNLQIEVMHKNNQVRTYDTPDSHM